MEVEGNFSRKWVEIPQGVLGSVEVEIVDMPYESAEYSMMAIRYSGNYFGDLADIENYVADKGILTVRETLVEHPTSITFPKFRMEYDRDLNEIFTRDTGLGVVFSARANYSGFADALYISNIIHKAVIEVTEEGTVASGASGGFFIQRAHANEMKFDVPFVFYIYHSCDGLVLFQGRYAYPTDK
jgi:serpin B